ncbi:hypothetical protein CJ739_1891 [Mariniflexile rhizosphaerae]|uniref:hypothetical protein n=1 Tax=unclassified Mariniflexile TaxID=2643887 RepID=UPI000CB82C2D|nr:hypothetical protein [Mariniflexile sp. TRM1-10]AXP80976.1 hypothetical protein CJ739_1891 [Mariniflexile sp. TRM1-10]PLB19945.1 MAG: hypothetical protein TRG1_1209 [Flavobacteriaceae bacterium FS1-H7996/R]
MSFDLNFYKKGNNEVSISEMVEFLNTIPMLESKSEDQIVYENETTGVFCLFETYESEESEVEDENDFEDLEDTNLCFNINYVRPDFFGIESFELVDKLIEKFDLYVLDPQAEAVPIKYKKGELLKSWLKSNEKISKSYFKEWELNYLELEKSNYCWEFCYNKNELQEKLTEEYFVPNIFYLNKNGTENVETLCVWPEHIPFVLPKVDFVLIQKRIKKLFRTKEESGLVKYETIIEKLGEYFENENDYKIIHPKNEEKIKPIFNSLEIFTTIEKYGKGISVDKIVNYKNE